MKIPRLALAMGYIDDDLIVAAEECKPKKKKFTFQWKHLVVVAACVVVVLSITLFTHNSDPYTNSFPVSNAPAHFYFGGNLYSYSGEVVFTLPENYKLVGEIKNVGDSFTGLDFEGNVDGYVYMNESDKTIAYFRWMEWDESIDGKEPYLKLKLIE